MARNPKAEVEITAQTRTLGARLREARATLKRFGGEIQKNVLGKDLVDKGFFSKAGAQLVGNLGASAVSSLGSLVVDQGRDVLAFNDALVRLQITANKTPEEVNAFGEAIRRASDQTGISARDILAGSQAYVALTGDFDGAAASARTWTRVAQATGSTVTDIAQTAAALKQQLNITPAETESAFAALAAQGKAGAIELKDLAAQLSSIAPQWAEFTGGKSIQGVKQLGAALQIVKRGFGGDASETVTGLQSLLNALIKNAARFQKAGIKVFDKDPKTGEKSLRSVFDIVDSIANSKLVKDPTKLEKALGRVEAYRAFLQLRNNRAELDKLVEVAGDATVIQRDLDTYLQSTGGRTQTAFEKAKNAIAEAFTPERIEEFTRAVEDLAPKIAPIVEGFLKIGYVLSLPFELGRKVRGAISGNNNPFYAEFGDDILTLNQYRSQGFGESSKQVTAARERAARSNANRVAYDRAAEQIIGAEINGGASPASVERAVLAHFADPSAPGGIGAASAGDRYLKAAGVTDAAADEIFRKAAAGALQSFAPIVVKAIQDGFKGAKTEVKADGKALVDVHRGSTAHARRPGG